MYSRNDPRVRRTLNQLSQNVASANESAQVGLFTFSHNYVNPCFSSIGSCVRACTAPCFPRREDRLRRQRGRPRGRAELNFDFYDDWEEEDENTGLLGWGSDEMDRLLSGSDAQMTTQQPGRQRTMNYGTRRGDARILGARRKSAVQPYDGGPDPTIIPNTSKFGFLERLPWKIGGKGLKYKPSAADLQDHPRASKRQPRPEAEPLVEENEEEDSHSGRGHRRDRSATQASARTTDSLSSRGDIFPSEDELEDAVPIDDEFAMRLERRTTNSGRDGSSSGKTRSSNRPSNSRTSTRTGSSRSTPSTTRRKRSLSAPTPDHPESAMSQVPSMVDLRREEEVLKEQEETEVESKRDMAQRLAIERGLSEPVYPEPLTPMSADLEEESTVPFPEFSSTAAAAIDSGEPLEARNPAELELVPVQQPRPPDTNG